MITREKIIRPCLVRVVFHYADGTYESKTVIGEERRNCPVSPETIARIKKFKADREAAISAAQDARKSA